MSGLIVGLVWELPVSKDFTSEDKFIALAYADHAWQDGTNAYPSVALVAEKTGYFERTVQRHVRNLAKIGLLIADGRGKFGTNKFRFPLKKRTDGSVFLEFGGVTQTPQKPEGGVTQTPQNIEGGVTQTPQNIGGGVTQTPEPKELKDLVVVVVNAQNKNAEPPKTEVQKTTNPFALYEENFGAITSLVKDELIDLEAAYGGKWLIAAMAEAVKAEARSLRFVNGILKNWKTNGFQSPKITPRGKQNGSSRTDNTRPAAQTPVYTDAQRAAAAKLRADRAAKMLAV